VEREIGIERPIRVLAPVNEQPFAQAVLGDGLEVARRDDLVGIDVIDGNDYGFAFEFFKLHTSFLTSVTTPVMAEAAAVNGLARKVRPPLPCRPSKLRLLVETLYSPGSSWSPFIARHMEQPASRKSAPASRNTLSRPSAIA